MNINRITLDDPSDFLDWRKGSGLTVEIYDIQVGSLRRRGKGRELVSRLLKSIPPEINTVWAITRASNLIAQDFYKGIGFEMMTRLKRFYQDEEPDASGFDAVIYAVDVRQPTKSGD